MTFPLVRAWLERCGLNPAELDFAVLERFVDDLYAQNEQVNLTAVPREECEVRHLVDSLAVVQLVPEGASVLDVGTGAGFPAWPLAWARPDLRVTALDSTEKRLRFIARHPLPNLSLLHARGEEVTQPEGFDFVTGRAVAPLPVQAEVSAGWVAHGGLFVPFRTPSEAPEATEDRFWKLGLAREGLVEVETSPDVVRLFPVYRKVGPMQAAFPRQWGQIKRKPL